MVDAPVGDDATEGSDQLDATNRLFFVYYTRSQPAGGTFASRDVVARCETPFRETYVGPKLASATDAEAGEFARAHRIGDFRMIVGRIDSAACRNQVATRAAGSRTVRARAARPSRSSTCGA